MPMTHEYLQQEPTAEQVEAERGALLLEFGSPGCGFCRAAQPAIAEALAGHPQVRHWKIADGRGRRLGRAYRVKLWPTLVFLRDGRELERLVRPQDAGEIGQALSRISAD